MNPAACSILFHNYYGQHEDWIRFFIRKIKTPFTLFYNIVEDSIYNLEDGRQGTDEEAAHVDPTGNGERYIRLADRMRQAASGSSLHSIILRRSPNQGKDIGGKLVLLDALLRTGAESDYCIFLHDKKSPYKIQNQEWKDKLFRIIEPSFMEKALAFFSSHKETGIITGIDSIDNEYDPSLQSFSSNNGPQLIQLQSKHNIDTTDYRYAAGTMFWARTSPLLAFFRAHPPLEIRKTLEKGNIMDETSGTNTHAWERLLSWLIFAQGYTIKGL